MRPVKDEPITSGCGWIVFFFALCCVGFGSLVWMLVTGDHSSANKPVTQGDLAWYFALAMLFLVFFGGARR